ncbi:MAG: M56 family metallopeptidase [Bacteroidia bacterium]
MYLANPIFTQILTEALGWTLLHSLWQGLVVMAALGILLSMMKYRTPESRYSLSLLALATMMTWMAGTFVSQYRSLYDRYIFYGYEEEVVVYENEFEAIELIEPAGGFHLGTITGTIRPFMPWVSVLWAAGFLFFTLRWAGGLYYVHRLRTRGVRAVSYDWQLKINKLADRLGLSRGVTLYESFRISVPMVIGHLKPVILVPAGMLNGISPAQLEAIIVHELAHIRRNDFLINLLISAAEAVLFYHPAYWWIAAHIQEEREHCCDDMVIKYCGDPLSYAKVLADLEENRLENLRFAMRLTDNKKHLLRRIKRILVPEAGEMQLQGKSVFGLVLVICLTTVAWLMPQTAKTFTPHAYVMGEDEYPLMAGIPAIPGMIGYPEYYSVIDTPPPGDVNFEGGWGEMPEMPEMPEFPEFPENFFNSDLPDSTAMADFRRSMQQYQEEQREWSEQVGEYWRDYAQQLSEHSRQYADLAREKQLAEAMEMMAKADLAGNDAYREAMEEARQKLEEARDRLRDDFNEEWDDRKEEEFQRRIEDAARRHEEALEREMAALERTREIARNQRDIQRRHVDMEREKMLQIREMQERIRAEQEQRMVEQQEKMQEVEEKMREKMREAEHKMHAEMERHQSMQRELRGMMLEDGLINSEDEKVKIRITDDAFKVNGKKLDDDQERKYRRILRRWGFDAGESGTIQFDF